MKNNTIQSLTPQEIVQRTKDKIVPLKSQEKTLWDIATLLSMHLNKIKAIEGGEDPDYLPQLSKLLIAPTGCGKTYLLSQMAKAVGLNFKLIDASTLSKTGYKGNNIDQILYKEKCAKELTYATSIILIDEFDKCALEANPWHRDGNIQANFLALLDGNGVAYEGEFVDTSRMLFLFCGAFQGLESIIKDRLSPKKLGFLTEDEKSIEMNDLMQHATMNDVQRYGFNRELLGRIGSLHVIPKLGNHDYLQLINGGKASAGEKYKRLFDGIGIEFSITNRACEAIGKQAEKLNLGARAINPILAETLSQPYRKAGNGKLDKIILDGSRDGDLSVAYIPKPRKKPEKKDFEKQLPKDSFNLFPHIQNEQSLNSMCLYMVQSLDLTPSDELLLFYFLQTTMRLLSITCRKEDQCFLSVKKIAKCTEIDERYFENTYSIMIREAMKGSFVGLDVMKQWYEAYEKLENKETCHTLEVLLNRMEEKLLQLQRTA